MSLFHIVYVSSCPALPGENELSDILAVSRRNNDRDDITGMLLYHDGCFFQVLEGEEKTVWQRYRTIEQDPRHRNCMTLLAEQTDARQFGQWSMGYIPFEKLSEESRETFFDLSAFRHEERIDAAVTKRDVKLLIRSFLSGFGAEFAS